MGIKIVRTPSETPNITNVDDIIPMRYAYGNQNGYVIDRGSELSGSYESSEFTVGSGRAVIQGVEIDIDANGISTTLDTASETRYFKIYLKVNLANDVVVLESYYSTVSYDEITDPTSSDLISGGDAYLLLYTLKLNGAVEVEKNKVVKAIEYINQNIAVMRTEFSGNNASQFGDYIVSKKKLLWSGDFEFSGTSFYEIDGFTNLSGKKIEIVGQVYRDEVPLIDEYFSKCIIARVRLTPISIYNHIAPQLNDYIHYYELKVSTYDNKLEFRQRSVKFNSDTNPISDIRATVHIYKVYEIIE